MSEWVGREDLVRSLWDQLRSSSVVLVGPRRIGKTRMLAEMESHPLSGFVLFRIDLQGLDSVEGMVGRVSERIVERGVLQRAGAAIQRVEGVEAAGVGLQLSASGQRDPWNELMDRLVAFIGRLDEGMTPVLALDEVPWRLDELEKTREGAARSALARLRHIREDRRLGKLRWILTGSVGLAGRAIEWKASAELNDLAVLEVSPLEESAGAALFETTCAAAGRSPDQAACKAAHIFSGGYPHWLIQLAERSRASGEGPIRVPDVSAQVDRLLSRQMRHMFQEEGQGHFERRYTEPERQAARAILSELAQTDSKQPKTGLVAAVLASLSSEEPDKALILKVLDRLIDEFYLAESPDRQSVGFAVPLIQRWWRVWA